MAARILDGVPKGPVELRAPIVMEHTIAVDCGGGAQITAPKADLEWQLRYGNPEAVRFCAAAVVASYDYLINSCTKDEVWRRIKLMRAALAAEEAQT